MSSDKASLNKVTSGTTPKARAFLLKGKGPKARAGARRAAKTRPRLLILAVATVCMGGPLYCCGGRSACDKACGWELLGGRS